MVEDERLRVDHQNDCSQTCDKRHSSTIPRTSSVHLPDVLPASRGRPREVPAPDTFQGRRLTDDLMDYVELAIDYVRLCPKQCQQCQQEHNALEIMSISSVSSIIGTVMKHKVPECNLAAFLDSSLAGEG